VDHGILINRGFERAAKREYESAEYQQGQAQGWMENSGDTAPPRLLRFSSRARPPPGLKGGRGIEARSLTKPRIQVEVAEAGVRGHSQPYRAITSKQRPRDQNSAGR